MIRVTWRQHRAEVLWSVLLLALLGILLTLSGREMFAAYQQIQQGTSVALCARTHQQNPICDALTSDFRRQFGDFSALLLILTILPALAGMFLGAPLVAREVERGTHQLVWTQGISRLRWIAVKIGALVLVTALLFGVFSLLLTWWRGPLDAVSGSRFSYGFDLEGAVPVGYGLFALALGIAAGTVMQRTLAAMATTLAGFVALRGVVEFALRPRYLSPVALITDPGQGNPRAYNGDWVLNNGFTYLDRQGHAISSADAVNLCTGSAKGATADFNICLHDHGVRLLNLYQPVERFWLFQGIESVIFLALAAALLGLAVWWVWARIS
jgi:hypothetical protein